MIGELIATGITYGVGRIALNDAFSGTAEFNNIILDSGANFSGGTGGGAILSGGTDLYNIFSTGGGGSTTASNGLTKSGDNITLGGTLTGNTLIDTGSNELLIDAGSTGFFTLSGNSSVDGQFVISNKFSNEPSSLVVQYGSASLGGENSAGTVLSSVRANSGSAPGALMQVFDGLAVSSILIQESAMTISDNINTKGIDYNGNYHANYGNRTLVDKEYVDNSVASGSTGSTTASNGLTKTGSNITLGGTLTGDTTITTDSNMLFVDAGASNGTIYFSGSAAIFSQINLESNLIPGQPASLQAGKGAARLVSTSGATEGAVTSAGGAVSFVRSGPAGQQSIVIDDATYKFEIEDGIFLRGINYKANYHANYLDRTLVDYEYVNNHVASGSTNATHNFGTSGGTVNWDINNSSNAKITLSSNLTLNISNVSSGDFGTLKITQDGVGSRTITLGTGTHQVVNSGSGSITLTANANAVDVITFFYDGVEFLWSVGNDYT